MTALRTLEVVGVGRSAVVGPVARSARGVLRRARRAAGHRGRCH